MEKLVLFLDENPEYSVVSSAMILFDENGIWGKTTPIERPNKNDFIKGTPFSHAASMFRAKDVKKIEGYRNIKRTLRVEDYDLWFRLYEQNKIGYNLIEPLYNCRDNRDAIRRRKYRFRINEAWVMRDGFKRLGIPFYKRIVIIKPLIVGLIPIPVYKLVRRIKYSHI